MSLSNFRAQRGALRSSLTKLINSTTKEDFETAQAAATLALLEDVAARVFAMDETIVGMLTDEEEICKEMDLSEDYRHKFIFCKTTLQQMVGSVGGDLKGNNCNSNTVVQHKLPKFDLISFDLSPKNWLAFWGQFERFHTSENMSELDKFQILFCCLKKGTKGYKVVESYPPCVDNYNLCINHLIKRFGREELVIEAAVTSILDLVDGNRNFADLVDKLHSSINTLQALGVGKDKFQLFLYPLLIKCLPKDILQLWFTHRTCDDDDAASEDSASVISSAGKDKITSLLQFLDLQIESREQVDCILKTGKAKTVAKPDAEAELPTAAALHVGGSVKAKTPLYCLFCNLHDSHRSSACRKAWQLTLSQRRDIVIKNKACFSCLGVDGHSSRSCKSDIKCKLCSQKHYPLMCNNNVKENVTTTCAAVDSSVTILKTLIAKINNTYVRVFLDDGSQRSYVKQSIVDTLHLKPDGQVKMSHGLFGGAITGESTYQIYSVEVSHVSNDYSCIFSLLGQEELCCPLPRFNDPKLLLDLKSRGIVLSDVGSAGAEVDVLLGVDMINKILTGNMIVLPSSIVATETRLGWAVQGVGKRKQVQSVAQCLMSFSEPGLWELDTLGIVEPIKNEVAEEAWDGFLRTINISPTGRYVVSLPWLAGHPPLSPNKSLAISRLLATTKRLRKQKLYEDYNAVLNEWLDKNIISEVSPGDEGYYLPHHAVVKEDSSSTRVRPVFDGSAKKEGYASLNECLNKGPNLIPLILPVLLRFREFRYGVSADITKAFLMLAMAEEERDFLRFLWWDAAGNIKEYRHNRVLFGASSSPFLLNASIKYLLEMEHAKDNCKIMQILRSSFYVDNCLTSLETLDELFMFQELAKNTLAERHFELRRWMSNATEMREVDVAVENVLGLSWHLEYDCLFVAMPKIDSNAQPSKRSILSVCNAIYDPLGILAAVVLVPKIILQQAWKLKLDWDDALPDDLITKFTEWQNSLHLLPNCSVPRGVRRGAPGKNDVLHIFCDASGLGFGAVIFLLSDDDLRFVVAKVRVAPVNQLTIPRLELMGAWLASKLYTSVIDAWRIPVAATFWTDSSVVLCWLRNQGPWKTFVGNRVRDILQVTKIEDWRHVPGHLNPADLLSRGCSAEILLESKWLEGPQWLRQPSCTWPVTYELPASGDAVAERKNIAHTHAAQILEKVEREPLSVVFSRIFERYVRLLKVVGFLLRFTYNCKAEASKRRRGPLSNSEMDKAEKALFYLVQGEWDEDAKSKGGLQFNKGADGLIRLKTKLALTNEVFDFREPPVLVDNPIVRIYVLYCHKTVMHAGVQSTLLKVRESAWLIHGRVIVKQVISKCIVCKRQSAKPLSTIEAPLPLDRVQRVACFQVTGVDYAGPLYLSNKGKAWIVVFTCAVYRAVHLELVTSLSTDAFLQAAGRMMARRGPVSIFWCDNGSNFVGAASATDSIDWDELAARGAEKRLHFRFITPASPWFGGWWEIMVKLVKNILRKCLGKSYLNYEELYSVLCSTESVINSRPLTYVSEEPGELEPLTPAMFCNEPKGNHPPEIDIIEERSLNKRFVYLQELRKQLKARFRQEYLSQLVHFRNIKGDRSLEAGEIVLIGTENVKRQLWPMARVLEVFPGRDGNVRVAKVKTSSGVLLRPVGKLYPLEVSTLDTTITRRPGAKDQEDLDESADQDEPVDESVCDKPEPLVCTKVGRRVVKPRKLDL